ncbi:hypothetical protein TNCV_4866231 [Trichonephila clavipes]|nr:hypothetical protein TNCV_4866231 [Trichonephila clavipes]
MFSEVNRKVIFGLDTPGIEYALDTLNRAIATRKPPPRTIQGLENRVAERVGLTATGTHKFTYFWCKIVV